MKVKLQSFWSHSVAVRGQVPSYQGLFFPIFICQESIRKPWFTFFLCIWTYKKTQPKPNKHNMNNSNVKKTNKLPRKKDFKILSLPCSQFPAVTKFNKGITYHRETACCFSVVHSVTDTMLEPDLKQRSLSFISINTWYS